ncbi:MAG TPA: inositol monophosphatase family protein [Gammaproteobacteria bacterium]|nr:inositol monophosphatase family protein [Gammaproteobacteria bacterium]
MARSELLETAIEAARAGERVIRHYYLDDVAVKLKSDRTPVTVADVETEEAIRTVIRQRFPDHGFYGEETGRDGGDSDYLWLIDPIDGTKSFVREYPFFSTQIAVMHRGQLVLGVSNAPMFGELAWAERGRGAWLNDAPVRVSGIERLDEATLSLGNIRSAAGSDLWPRIGALVAAVNRTRGYGDFYHYHLLAAGKLEIVLESDLNILDIAALTVIVREAGGIVMDLQGGDVNLDTSSILATNAGIRDRVVELLGG